MRGATRVFAALAALLLLLPGAAPVPVAPGGDADWWDANDARTFGPAIEYRNEYGRLRVLNTGAPAIGRDHPFFTPLGSNGRACVTCHQPAAGMSISAKTIQRRWEVTQGRDPLFAAIDGSNCPSLPQGKRESHSLLLERGLFRIGMPWPPRGLDGKGVQPEFTIEVVRDPTGCNTDPQWGLKSANPTVSVFRRPRPVANVQYLTELPHGVPPHEYFMYNDKRLLPKDPETGAFVSQQLMADGRLLTLRLQARDAARNHLQRAGPLTKEQVDRLEAFVRSIQSAQGSSRLAGDFGPGTGAPPGLGPEALRDGPPAELGNNAVNAVFGSFRMWQAKGDASTAESQGEGEAFRQSVARGAEIFRARRFYIRDVGVYNDKGLGNPFKRSCASGCHNTILAGMDLAPGFMDLGLNNYPWAQRNELPLFRVVCDAGARPQSYLGRTIYTHDPGRALVTGRCADVGATMTQQMRGLAGRAPYFMNGSAANLRELVDFYDRRFNIGYTEQEKRDLVNFMGTL